MRDLLLQTWLGLLRTITLCCFAGGLACLWVLVHGGRASSTSGGALVIIGILYLVLDAGGAQPQNLAGRIVSRGVAGPTTDLPLEAGAPVGWSIPLCAAAVITAAIGVMFQFVR